jgi:VWFA-related protein
MRTTTFSFVVLFLVAGLSVPAQQPPAGQQTPPAQPPRQQTPATGAAGEQPPLTFKVEINYVEIDAIVTDQQGNFVRNLTKDDFQIVEQGKPQSVSIFSLVDIPIERFDPPLYKTKPIEPDVRSNQKEFDGRVFVMVLDDLNISFSRSARVKAAAKQFIDRYLGANDLAAVVTTGGAKGGGQEFTSSRERLTRAVDAFMGQKERSATLEKIDDYNRQRAIGSTNAPRDPLESYRVFRARNTYSTLKNVSDYMAGIRGRRKAVIFISEGIDYDIYNPIQNTYTSDILDANKETVAAATRANVSIYSVDPRGLAGLEDAIDLQSIPDDPTLGIGVGSLQRELQISQDSLRTLSDETGGFAAVNSNDFKGSFDRIIRDNSSYYILGYYSTDTRRDGRFRSINVRVNKPGLEVRARKGYVAPKGRPPAGTPPPPGIAASIEMREALNSPVPFSGLGLRATAVPLMGSRSVGDARANAPAARANQSQSARCQGNCASVLIVVEIDGGRLKFKPEGSMFADDVEVAILAVDEGGKTRDGSRDVAKLQLRPETHAAVVKNGIRLTRRLELPPGRYQLRIGAREAGGGLSGSVFYDIDVPDFTKPPLAISGLLITSASASRTPTANPDPEFKDIMPASPATLRDFPSGDELSVAADIYDNRASTPHRVEVRTTVTGDDGQVVFSSRDERRTEDLKGANGSFGHLTSIPLKGIAPGRYVLKIEAQALLSNGGTAAREVEFTIRP